MVLAPPLYVGRPLVSVLHPDKRGLKEQLIRGPWLTQAVGRDRYRMWGKPVVVEAAVTLQQPGAHHHMFSWGSCPWIIGPWHWQAA